MAFSRKLRKILSVVGRSLAMVYAARDGAVEIRRLLDLPEAELRRRGLSREDVVRRVFANHMAIG